MARMCHDIPGEQNSVDVREGIVENDEKLEQGIAVWEHC